MPGAPLQRWLAETRNEGGGTLNAMRKAGAAILFMLAGAGMLLALAAISNIWAGYKDSTDSVYIQAAAWPFAFGLLCAVGGFLALRQR